ncbi:HET domain protein [Akanthomyces lecanii RCEF 1005]|uniref:HET domain protein n=1 Tax=Akanthomyces lecanii RCEF 1005 TaxID=1081108 RepID=A0A168J6C1_CORDF|nr:HET domain protein [Akanthomyces lecanii RCEF 1005]
MQARDRSYKHAKLPPRYIRVLELQPSASTDAALACRLREQTIADEPYEALSYVWGKPTVFHSTIWCVDEDHVDSGGGTLRIGANLATALVAYRRLDQPRRIWVDAICIRQDDLDERLSQVRMMGDIFRNATQVLCWLGAFQEPATDEHLALAAIHFLREFNEDQTGHLRRIKAAIHKSETETREQSAKGDHDGEQQLLKTWRAVKTFFDIEYFHRAWIIQEIGLARRAWIAWGRSDICIDWAEVARFVLFLDDNGASVINALDLKSWVCNHINLVWSNKPDGTPLFDFSEVLHWARVHLSTDPRDFVYSLLGHPSAVVGGQLLIEPVYTLSTARVYTQLVVNIIQRTRSLHILAFVDHGEEPSPMGLPTWVPDWQGLNLVAPLRCPTRAASLEYCNVAVDDGGSRKTPALRCQGALVSSLRAYSSMIDPKELAITDYAAEAKKKLPFLIDHIYARLVLTQPAETRPSADYFISALSFILTGAHRGTTPAASGPARDEQRADCAAHAVHAEALRTTAEPGPFFGSLSAEEASQMQALAALGCAAQVVQDMTWTSMCRRVFITRDGQLGLGPRIMAGGDVVAVLPGSRYPLLLREKTGGAETEHELVGPVLLYGFMNSEVAEAPAGTFVEQEFCLV